MAKYTLQDLERLSGIRSRTIRDWILRGLLPSAERRGPGATYTREHLDRLLAIRRLREEVGMNLETIGAVLERLDDETLRRVASGEEPIVALPWLESPTGAAAARTDVLYQRTDEDPSREAAAEILYALHRLQLLLAKGPPLRLPEERLQTWYEARITPDLYLRLRNGRPGVEMALEDLARALAQGIRGTG